MTFDGLGPNLLSIRNASDPQVPAMPGGQAAEKTWAGKIYERYGYWDVVGVSAGVLRRGDGAGVKLKPFTLKHYEAYVSRIVLDTNAYWEFEPFQGEVAEPILWAVRRAMENPLNGGCEVWTIIPEGNSKTTMMAALGLYCCDYSPLPWIPIGASSRDQANILAEQSYQMIRSSPVC